jgi:hypothetical protein
MEYTNNLLMCKRINISELDIDACKNVGYLLNWQMEALKDIANIEGQIEMCAAKFHTNGEQSDHIQYAKRRQAKRFLELFVKKINIRISEINAEKDDTKAVFNAVFIEAARDILCADTMKDILIEARKRL